MKHRAFVIAIVASSTLLVEQSRAFCPSYTLSSASNTRKCAIEAVVGSNPSVSEWQAIFQLVSQGPSAWGNAGPQVGTITQGCGMPEPAHAVAPQFPCEILKAIAMVESGWKQFCVPDRPSDQAHPPERTIISFDCGYGIGQVTSGMHIGELPSFDRNRVASDPTYNLATGTRILAEKWRATKCVGDRQPKVIEHWYSAVWAYNGLAWSNNPNNPNLTPNRGVYNPTVGGTYTYQERVFGYMERPPSASHWTSVALAYPSRTECGQSGSPPILSEPRCSSPTNCDTARETHVSSCFREIPDAGPDGLVTDDAGGYDTRDPADIRQDSPTPVEPQAPIENVTPRGTPSAAIPPLPSANTLPESSDGLADNASLKDDEGSGCACRMDRPSRKCREPWPSFGIVLLAGLSGVGHIRRRTRARASRRA